MNPTAAGTSIAVMYDNLMTRKREFADALGTLSLDLDMSLFDRWCIFLSFADEAFPKDCWIPSGGSELRSYIDEADRYFERHQEVSLAALFEEYYIDVTHLGNYSEQDCSDILENFTELPEALVEEILQDRNSGFTYDW